MPWGMVAVSAALTLFLGGILAYSIANQGEGYIDPLERITQIKGVATVPAKDIKAGHREGPLRFAQNPPNSGEHNPIPQTCGAYTEPIANEHAVHSLEHGAVWITYQPTLPKDQIKKLTDLVENSSHRLLSPYPGQKSPINASAWGMRLSVNNASDDRLEEFTDAAENGPQTPEKGAACSGNSAPGPVKAAQPRAPRASVPVVATLPPRSGAATAPGSPRPTG